MGPKKGPCSGQPSQPCLTRAVFWDMEKATWKWEETDRTCSPLGGRQLPAPRGGSHRRTATAHPTSGACCGCWGHVKERARRARGGEGACDMWPASVWKRLTSQERGALTFGGFGAINHRPGSLKRIEYIQFYRILSFI